MRDSKAWEVVAEQAASNMGWAIVASMAVHIINQLIKVIA